MLKNLWSAVSAPRKLMKENFFSALSAVDFNFLSPFDGKFSADLNKAKNQHQCATYTGLCLHSRASRVLCDGGWFEMGCYVNKMRRIHERRVDV
jgi:hypothetical protein